MAIDEKITSNADHTNQLSKGERFQFGKNWQNFLSTLDEERIEEAIVSLKIMLEVDTLEGKTFLDAGSGSGLFSLAAKILGASVYSFDFDPESVSCTKALKNKYFQDDKNWQIEEASVLDKTYIKQLGQFDIVFSWGVLHHTGDMNTALENIITPVSSQGTLFIAIYNDQGLQSKAWRKIKKTYCSGLFGQALVAGLFLPLFTLLHALLGLIESGNIFSHFTQYKKRRGMSIYYDWLDWLGGYPFEVAKPEFIFDYYKNNGFNLQKLITKRGWGCNEFVFIHNCKMVLNK